MHNIVTALRDKIREYVTLDVLLTQNTSIGDNFVEIDPDYTKKFTIKRFFSKPVSPLKLTLYDSTDSASRIN